MQITKYQCKPRQGPPGVAFFPPKVRDIHAQALG